MKSDSDIDFLAEIRGAKIVKHGALLMDEDAIRRVLMRIAHEIVEHNQGVSNLTLVGIRRRGVPLSERIAANLKLIEDRAPLVGSLDIGLYRDDLADRPFSPLKHTSIRSSMIDRRTIVLIDDVLFTGRTVRAALDALSDFGRPQAIQLAVLIDRGHRELPIRADYVGKNVPTSRMERIHVEVKELDDMDRVYVEKMNGVEAKE